MLRVPPGDDLLRGLVGATLPSNVYPSVDYRLDKALGAGSMAVAFLVERHAPTGIGVAVIKIVRPEFVRPEFVERVKLSEHWQHQPLVPNLLADGADIWS